MATGGRPTSSAATLEAIAIGGLTIDQVAEIARVAIEVPEEIDPAVAIAQAVAMVPVAEIAQAVAIGLEGVIDPAAGTDRAHDHRPAAVMLAAIALAAATLHQVVAMVRTGAALGEAISAAAPRVLPAQEEDAVWAAADLVVGADLAEAG